MTTRVLRRIGLAARRVAAARVLEVEQREIGVLPIVLRERDRRALALLVDELDAIDVKARVMQLGLDMPAAEIGQGRAAADLLAVGRQPEGDGDGMLLGGRRPGRTDAPAPCESQSRTIERCASFHLFASANFDNGGRAKPIAVGREWARSELQAQRAEERLWRSRHNDGSAGGRGKVSRIRQILRVELRGDLVAVVFERGRRSCR